MKPMTITLDYQDYLDLIKKAESKNLSTLPPNLKIIYENDTVTIDNQKYKQVSIRRISAGIDEAIYTK